MRNPTLSKKLFGEQTRPKEQTSEKLRGGYYTPGEISDFLVKWAIQKKESKILEPSCGDGQFIESVVREFGESAHITALELFPDEASKALNRGNAKTRVIVSDAFTWYQKNKPDKEFDAVIGNPPFIRFQNFPENHREPAFQLMREEGLSPSRLTNSWLPFVVLATRALKDGGRLAIVLPAELLQVTYARGLRRYLSTKYSNISIVTFRRLVFANILQEVVLVMGERKDCDSSSISMLEFEDLSDLHQRQFISKKKQHKILDIQHDNEKWTQFYLSGRELGLIRSIESSKSFVPLGEIAEVDVGIVTGNNDFFILDSLQATQLGISEYCSPIVGRSRHLAGINFTKFDYRSIYKSGERVLLLNPGKIPKSKLTKELVAYIEEAERMGITGGYKCKIRLPHWWQVPSVWTPDAFLLRQIYEGPKIIANQTLATSTDTVHRVRMTTGVTAKLLAATSLNSLTFALSEIRGRSYGGGVLELEPSEAESLLLPSISNQDQLPVEDIDTLVRSKDTIGALDLVDSIVLRNAGLEGKEILILREIWMKLKGRRNARNRSQR